MILRVCMEFQRGIGYIIKLEGLFNQGILSKGMDQIIFFGSCVNGVFFTLNDFFWVLYNFMILEIFLECLKKEVLIMYDEKQGRLLC